MFVEKWQLSNIFVYWYDGLRVRHLTTIVGTRVGHLPMKVSRAGHLTNFFKCLGVCPGECSQLELTRAQAMHD